MRRRLLVLAIPLIIMAGCKRNEAATNATNVDENLTTIDMNVTTNATDTNATETNAYSNAAATSMNASAGDNDVLAPLPIKKGHGK